MLNQKLVPTRLIDPAKRLPLIIRPVVPPSRFRLFEFAWRLLRWMAHVLWLFLQGDLSRDVYARSVRRLFEDLGGFWIKIAQLLSLRVDMFSEELCTQLAHLQGNVAGFPAKEARRIVEQELGAPIERYFDEFSELPFAAASIGQIHRAHLKRENVWVAVKIQRPHLPELFARDLAIVRWVVRLLQLFGVYSFMRWDVALGEISQIMREELDCRYEAAAYSRMKKPLKKHKVYVPEVFRQYTTKNVMVSEFIHASLMSDYVQVAARDPVRLASWLYENNIEPHKLSLLLLESGFRQIFEENSYHGDMHPGNILLLRDSRVALIDFGAIAFTELEYWQRSKLFVKALVMADYAKAADTAFLLCGALPNDVDLERVKEKLIEELRAWGARTLVRDLEYRDKSLTGAFAEAGRILFRNGFAMQWALMRVQRGVATLDASIVALYPDIDTGKVFRRFMRRAERRHLQIIAGPTLIPRIIKGIGSAIDVAENAYEQAVYQGSLIRRQAQVFEGTTSKFAYLFAVLYRQLSVLQFVAGILFIAIFLFQKYPATIKPWIGPQVSRLLGLVPHLDTQLWLLILAVNLYLLISAVKLWKVFAAKDLGPGDNGPR